MITKINTGLELYVYMNGTLLYKRWLEKGYGVVFDRQPFTAKDVEQFKKHGKN